MDMLYVLLDVVSVLLCKRVVERLVEPCSTREWVGFAPE